jgi:hypothetical protein
MDGTGLDSLPASPGAFAWLPDCPHSCTY